MPKAYSSEEVVLERPESACDRGAEGACTYSAQFLFSFQFLVLALAFLGLVNSTELYSDFS